jgi:hypothetical protein
MRTIQRLALGLTLAAATLAATAQSPATITPSADSTASHNWTSEQILTCTVSQCWQLAGRNEAGFFDIVQQLAALSAQNRNITLPDDAAAGQRMGNYIKKKANEDRDALLYAVVDASVRYVGNKNKNSAIPATR